MKQPKGYSRTGLSAKRIREVLMDGEWRSLPWLIAELSSELSPEGATRRIHQNGTKYEDVARLKGRVITDSVRNLARGDQTHYPQLERRIHDGVEEFRLRPEYRSQTSGSYLAVKIRNLHSEMRKDNAH